MAMTQRTVRSDNLGAWVLKCDPKVWDLALALELGDTNITGWSLAQSYRLNLMKPGQPVVFWVSGPKKGSVTFRGVWGFGRLTGGAEWSEGMSAREAKSTLWLDWNKATEPGWYVKTDIPLLENPIPADEFLADPILAGSEVVRAQQQSNPVFFTKEEYRALLALRKSWPTAHLADEEPATVTPRGAGFGTAEQNRRVELAAMKAVTEHYEKAGYVVRDVSRLNLGWDLTAIPETMNENPKHIEVKGTSGSLPRVLLTRNEFATSQVDADWELAVVTQALSQPSLTIHSAKSVAKAVEPFAWEADLS